MGLQADNPCGMLGEHEKKLVKLRHQYGKNLILVWRKFVSGKFL